MIQKEVFGSISTTGAIGKMSKSISQSILNDVDWQRVSSIVEFGPGRGNITQEILNRMRSDARLICFEINPTDFEPHLSHIVDERISIYYTSCASLLDYVGVGMVDVIVSTVPLSLIDRDVVTQIMESSHQALSEGGMFITGQYSPYASQFMKPLFGTVTKRRHLRNLPPVCILTSTKISPTL